MDNPLETDTLDEILKRLWQNGYGINRYKELREQIAREIEAIPFDNPDAQVGEHQCYSMRQKAAAIARGVM